MAIKRTVRAIPNIDGLGDALSTAFDIAPAPESVSSRPGGKPILLDIEQLSEDPENARKCFDESALIELAETIREHGILEPLIVVRIAEDHYQIRSGARRFRAARIAGIKQIPIWIVNEVTALAAVIVNLQRENLHPIEIGNALAAIASAEGMSAQQIASSLGRSKTWVSRYLTMSRLSDEDKRFLRDLNTSDATLLSDVSKLLNTHQASVRKLAESGSLDRTTVSALLASEDTRRQGKPGEAVESDPRSGRSTKTAQEKSGAKVPSLVIEHEGAEWILDLAKNGDSDHYQITLGTDSSVHAEVSMPIKLLRIQG